MSDKKQRTVKDLTPVEIGVILLRNEMLDAENAQLQSRLLGIAHEQMRIVTNQVYLGSPQKAIRRSRWYSKLLLKFLGISEIPWDFAMSGLRRTLANGTEDL